MSDELFQSTACKQIKVAITQSEHDAYQEQEQFLSINKS